MHDQHRSKFARLLGIVERLQSGPRYNVRDLAEEFNVNRRTIFRDIVFLREAGFYITVDEQTQKYRCSGGKSSITIPRFDLVELEALLLAAETSPIRKMGSFSRSLNNATSRLLNKISFAQRETLGKSLGCCEFRIRDDDGGTADAFFRKLRDAAVSCRAIRVQHRECGQLVWEEITPRKLIFENEWRVEAVAAPPQGEKRIRLADIFACEEPAQENK